MILPMVINPLGLVTFRTYCLTMFEAIHFLKYLAITVAMAAIFLCIAWNPASDSLLFYLHCFSKIRRHKICLDTAVYGLILSEIIEMLVLYLTIAGTPKDKLPLAGPWKHGSIKEFLANVEKGKSVPGK